MPPVSTRPAGSAPAGGPGQRARERAGEIEREEGAREPLEGADGPHTRARGGLAARADGDD